MKHVLVLLTAALLAGALSSCGAAGGIPSSSISIYDGSNKLISTSSTMGDLELTVGQVYQFKVQRLVADSHSTDNSEVTTVCKYFFIPDGICKANSLGQLTALVDGTTRMEVRFRPSGLDEADHVYLNIRVKPAPAMP